MILTLNQSQVKSSLFQNKRQLSFHISKKNLNILIEQTSRILQQTMNLSRDPTGANGLQKKFLNHKVSNPWTRKKKIMRKDTKSIALIWLLR